MVSLLFIGLVVTILITPGPTNTLLASSGIQMGVKRSLKLIPSEVLGYFIAISLWGLLIESVSGNLPWLPAILKLVSASYIVFLALKLWKTSTQQLDIHQPTITAKTLFFATLLNPKGLLFASAIFPKIAWSEFHQYAIHMGTFLVLITPIAFLWVVFGAALISNKISWLNQRNMQRTASLVLITFSIPLSYSAITAL
ncbi:LysE family translocator [Acinetobacter qingfengensis]|uniref:Multidrug transporter MatE n=1 Tax=Acinetobacter qingfengensis TaxID=1262585 RepID=A0A1E7R314_9GAMM|nr:LysE family transporter [Acinetobacter qingfengensis]KAA8733797.1 LysE family translocator [Acinetobacter qingfengensis]OEY93691.1 multidrug transporter MatE [Acinetobacter qingfengensis]